MGIFDTGAPLYAALGFFAGVIGGMGIGGGTVLIPGLVILCGMNQQSAQCLTLVCFAPMAAAALFVHAKRGDVETRHILRIVIFGVATAVLGSWLASLIEAWLLRRIFAVFLLLMGAREVFSGKVRKAK